MRHDQVWYQACAENSKSLLVPVSIDVERGTWLIREVLHQLLSYDVDQSHVINRRMASSERTRLLKRTVLDGLL